MKSAQLLSWNLPSKTIAAGQSDTIEGKLLPKMLFGMVMHLSKISATAEFAPTYTTAPTTVGNNNVYTRFDFFDGNINRFTGGWNHLRMFERLISGRNRTADADTDLASASTRVVRRTLHMGPPNYAGAPVDFAIPCGMLETAELRTQVGALTDISADTTVLTGTTRYVAGLVGLGKVRIPPVYERKYASLTGSDGQLQGRSAYDVVALLNSGSFDAISAGDFDSISLDLGQGYVVPAINARDLTSQYMDDKDVGDFNSIMGQPQGAGDDNAKMVNRASPTAIAAQTADLQPVLWTQRDQMLTKLNVAETSARIFWGGSQSTGIVLTGRFLPQSQAMVGAAIAKAFSKLPFKPSKTRPSTLSKKPYMGPFVEFMPWDVDVAAGR